MLESVGTYTVTVKAMYDWQTELASTSFVLEIKDCLVNCDHGPPGYDTQVVVEIASFGVEVDSGQIPEAFT